MTAPKKRRKRLTPAQQARSERAKEAWARRREREAQEAGGIVPPPVGEDDHTDEIAQQGIDELAAELEKPLAPPVLPGSIELASESDPLGQALFGPQEPAEEPPSEAPVPSRPAEPLTAGPEPSPWHQRPEPGVESTSVAPSEMRTPDRPTVATPDTAKGEIKAVYFVCDGFTALGHIWYYGQELVLDTASEDYKRTCDRNGVSWMDMSEDQQIHVYEEVKFKQGRWPYAPTQVEQVDNEEQRRAEKRAQRDVKPATPLSLGR